MRLSLRFMGLDLIDLSIETDSVEVEVEHDGVGDCTTCPVGFTPSAEYEVPDRSLE